MCSPSLIEAVRGAGQDYEFYPTTQEIIDAMIGDYRRLRDVSYHGNRKATSVLDIGAGSGKVLRALRDADLGIDDLYAIEKSEILCRELSSDILVIGTNFEEQSLLSKSVDIVFSNPPYSVFEDWCVKIIREASCSLIYLVIPARWQTSERIADARKWRDARIKNLGEFRFIDSEDRPARGVVNLLRVRLKDNRNDAFERFFEEQFADLISKFDGPEAADSKERPTDFADLVVGPTYPEALVNLYTDEMSRVERNYRLIGDLDPSLLREFEIYPSKIMSCLRERLNGLRNIYWSELFSHLTSITDRLTSKSRQSLLGTLQRHVQVDFTLSNIYAVIIWAIKNANQFLDSQLISTYEMMVSKCNVRLYKSNNRAWVDDRWRYSEAERNTHYSLDFRIVMHRVGGIRNTSYSFEKGLEERAAAFLGDLLTIANNLGFRCDTVSLRLTSQRDEWKSGTKEEFYYTDEKGKRRILFEVRAFKNGNLHLRLNQKFILALNVEHGRLQGWLRSASEAVEELAEEEAAQYFQTSFYLPSSPLLALAAREAA